MRCLPNINLTETDIRDLNIDTLFNYGGEAEIYRTNNPHTLYKLFPFPCGGMSDNKFEKVKILYRKRPKGQVEPVSTLSYWGELIGYELTYDEEDEALDDVDLSEEDSIYYLDQTKDILESYVEEDITYGDITKPNILINRRTKTVKFCDIDNMRVGQYPIDVMSPALDEYYHSMGIIDQKADAYMHNLLFLSMMYYQELFSYPEILKELATNPNERLPLPIKRIAMSMLDPKKFSGEYSVQYIKKRG